MSDTYDDMRPCNPHHQVNCDTCRPENKTYYRVARIGITVDTKYLTADWEYNPVDPTFWAELQNEVAKAIDLMYPGSRPTNPQWEFVEWEGPAEIEPGLG